MQRQEDVLGSQEKEGKMSDGTGRANRALEEEGRARERERGAID